MAAKSLAISRMTNVATRVADLLRQTHVNAPAGQRLAGRHQRRPASFSKLQRATLALLACVCIGCAPAKPQPTDLQQASAVLKTALDAWKNGKSPEQLQSDTPPIFVVDQRWRAKAKLLDYKIQTEGNNLETSVAFPVVLQLSGAKKPVDAVYFVSTNPALTVTLSD